jgi:prepilin-type N-terminal cleavage/methylation domain-containing protein
MRRPRRRAAQAGFTLIELMITLVLFSVAIAGVLAVAVSMTNGFREQRAVIFAEGAARGAMDFLSDAIRQASPGVLTGNITAIDISGCPAGTFTTTNNQGSPGAPDRLKLVFAYGSISTTSTTVYADDSTSLTVVNAEQLAVGDHIVITNSAVAVIVEITGKTGNDLTLAGQQCDWLTPIPAGSTVVRALRAELFVQDIDTNQPALWMDPDAEGPAAAEPLAEGIEDFQVAVGVDTNLDGQLSEVGIAADDDEWAYNVAGDAAPVGTLRALRITLVARSPKAVNGIGTFIRPAAEDRAAAAATDGYRRRTLTSNIEIRNLGGSP